MAAVGSDDLLLIGRNDTFFLIGPRRGLWHGKDADEAVFLMRYRPSRPFPRKKAGAG